MRNKSFFTPGPSRALLGVAIALFAATRLQAATPVTPNATQTTKDVLDYLEQVVAEDKILSGQQLGFYLIDLYNTDTSGKGPGVGPGSPGGPNDYSEFVHIHDLTGKWPAVLGLNTERDTREDLVGVALQQWNDGGLVTFSSAQRSPIDNQASHFSDLTAQQFDDLLTPGTEIHANWLAYIDKTASHFKILRDAGVVIIWRPYHEVLDGNFWWSKQGPERYRRLWRSMFDRYANDHQLNNLIWCWCPKYYRDASEWYPGDDYVDVGGDSVYTASRELREANLARQISNTGDGSKVLALAEVGQLHKPSELERSPWAWFNVWRGYIDKDKYPLRKVYGDQSTAAEVQEVYAAPVTITRDELPDFRRSSDGGAESRQDESKDP